MTMKTLETEVHTISYVANCPTHAYEHVHCKCTYTHTHTSLKKGDFCLKTDIHNISGSTVNTEMHASNSLNHATFLSLAVGVAYHRWSA